MKWRKAYEYKGDFRKDINDLSRGLALGCYLNAGHAFVGFVMLGDELWRTGVLILSSTKELEPDSALLVRTNQMEYTR